MGEHSGIPPPKAVLSPGWKKGGIETNVKQVTLMITVSEQGGKLSNKMGKFGLHSISAFHIIMMTRLVMVQK